MKAGRTPKEGQNLTKMDRLVDRVLAPVALIGGLLLILYVTLKSLDFQFRHLSVAGYFDGFQFVPSSIFDFPLNIFLFVPFGFGLAALLGQARLSKRATFLSVLLAGFLLTWLIESVQFFLPARTPNVADIIANTLGALFGLGLYRAWQNRRYILPIVLKPNYLLLSLLIYLLLLSGFGIILRDRARLDNWRPRFPLIIGNEKTGDRPWAGTVTDLTFLDRALPLADVQTFLLSGNPVDAAGDSLAAYYPLEDANDLADQTGNLSDFYWISESGLNLEEDTLQLDGRNWLRTEWAVIDLDEKLAAASEFTVMLSVSTADLQQTGPARIVSISATPYYRNLTLGQEGQGLVVRVRMPLTGQNATLPEIVIPDFFVDQMPHNLVVTYDSLALTVYIDDTQGAHNLEIVPGIAFFYAFFGPFAQTLTVNPAFITLYKILFYLLAFVPLGFLLALMAAQLRHTISRLLLLSVGSILPALLLEILLTSKNGYGLRLPNILFATAVTAVSYLLLMPAARRLVRSR